MINIKEKERYKNIIINMMENGKMETNKEMEKKLMIGEEQKIIIKIINKNKTKIITKISMQK